MLHFLLATQTSTSMGNNVHSVANVVHSKLNPQASRTSHSRRSQTCIVLNDVGQSYIVASPPSSYGAKLPATPAQHDGSCERTRGHVMR
jgi:hypothetical protein